MDLGLPEPAASELRALEKRYAALLPQFDDDTASQLRRLLALLEVAVVDQEVSR